MVVTGAGDAFCAGGDVKAIAGASAPDRPAGAAAVRADLIEKVHRIPYALERLDTPVIAAVNGPAVGAGMDGAHVRPVVQGPLGPLLRGYVRAGLIPGDGAPTSSPGWWGWPRRSSSS